MQYRPSAIVVLANLAVGPACGLVLPNARPGPSGFAADAMSEAGQAVLARTVGAVDPAKSREFIRGIVRVTGVDGEMAACSLAELAPRFANRPVQPARPIRSRRDRDRR